MNIHILYGQGGRPLSLGMDLLAWRLRGVLRPGDTLKMWNWGEAAAIMRAILDARRETPQVLAGFSLGANTLTYLAARLARTQFKLVLAFDPSNGLPGLPAFVYPLGSNVERAICFHGTFPDPLGHALLTGHLARHGAKLEGRQVETYSYFRPHLAMSFAGHSIALRAVEELQK